MTDLTSSSTAAPLDDLLAGASRTATSVGAFAWSPKAKPLEGRRALLRVMLYVYLAFQAMGFILIVAELVLMAALKTGADISEIPGVPLFATIIVLTSPWLVPAGYFIFGLCALFYFLFVYRAAKNLDLSRARGLEMTPATTVWMSFVPFVNLGAIPTAMRQIWRASAHPTNGMGSAPAVFTWWWASYLINGVLSAISNAMAVDMDRVSPGDAFDHFLPAAGMGIASAVLLVISTFCLLNIIAMITRLQRDLASAAVFA